MEETRRQTIEYKFLRQNTHHPVPRLRFSFSVYLAIFHVAFIALFAFFSKYHHGHVTAKESSIYPMFMDVHSMMFVGFGFLMTFLKRYGYGSVGFNFVVASYVLEWALLVRGWLSGGSNGFSISLENLLVSDFCAAAVLISFGAVLGKASLSQLIIMATFEVVIQSVNEHIGLHYLHAYDVGESMYVHVFGAYFGLAVAKVLQGKKEIESTKESSHYHSDLFSMIGTLFLWLYWPSFNSATAKEEGQLRAIVNTYLAISASCVTTYIISLFVGKGRLNMVHVQNATLAGGVAVGTIADMAIQPFGALIIGTVAGLISTLGFEYLTPKLNSGVLHDTCGVHNLHGLPGVLSGLAGALVAALASQTLYQGNLYKYYPSMAPIVNSTEIVEAVEGLGRTTLQQSGYQLAALGTTIAIALVGGVLTGLIMRIPIIEQVSEIEEMFDDEPHWRTPEDYSLKLTEVRVQQRTDEEIGEKSGLNTTSA